MPLFVILLGILLAALPTGAQQLPELNWEPRSDWINVRTGAGLRAAGEGAADDTAALPAAMDRVRAALGDLRRLESLDLALNYPSNSLTATAVPNSPIRPTAEPTARLAPAPAYKFPANPDCNSPCFWSEGRLHLFTSNQRPSISSGPDLERLGKPEPCRFDDNAKKLRWIEAVYLRDDSVLFGLYHREEYLGECPDREFFTVPDIGLARSKDQGRTWTDLGIVLQDLGVKRSCDTPNKFFAGGVGDPSWAIDRLQSYAYIFFSSYTDPVTNQGVQIARLSLADLDAPVGKVWRWRSGQWDSPGIGGAGTPIVPARIAWSDPKADAFWGPSVHWNTYLGTHVVLVNHASDANWTQEGIYLFFARDLTNPGSFTRPRKIHDGGEWYAQVVGDPEIRGTDSLAGKSARFFMHGTSNYRIEFEKP